MAKGGQNWSKRNVEVLLQLTSGTSVSCHSK